MYAFMMIKCYRNILHSLWQCTVPHKVLKVVVPLVYTHKWKQCTKLANTCNMSAGMAAVSWQMFSSKYFLRGLLKGRVYMYKQHSTDDLKTFIKRLQTCSSVNEPIWSMKSDCAWTLQATNFSAMWWVAVSQGRRHVTTTCNNYLRVSNGFTVESLRLLAIDYSVAINKICYCS
jgi:hypothetical protein